MYDEVCSMLQTPEQLSSAGASRSLSEREKDER